MKDEYLDSFSGLMFLAFHALVTLIILLFAARLGGAGALLFPVVGFASFVLLKGYYTLEPNQVAVMTLFGDYKGTTSSPGLRWNNPFYSARKVSLRTRNFESSRLKVNDREGNPIEIAAVVVWKVEDAAAALLKVDNYDSFVHIQAESALRSVATQYAYDSHQDGHSSLRDNPEEIAKELMEHIQERVNEAGVRILEARLTHLAYAPEIAHAMLQRQQASAVIAARTLLVEGAVGMVHQALEKLSEKGMVQLDEVQKAQMVGNLLVVLCSDRAASPIVNAGITPKA